MAQRIFINNLPGYQALPPCAESPVNTIVRIMYSGCGDNKRTTSYSCFCTASSAKFVSIISKEVAKRCLPDTATAVAQATELFGSYCAIGLVPHPVCIRNNSRNDDPIQPECIPDGVAGRGLNPPNVARVTFPNRRKLGRCEIPIVQANLGIRLA
ncbi:hypothetical protein PG987_008272 [Apiospora arundinis]